MKGKKLWLFLFGYDWRFSIGMEWSFLPIANKRNKRNVNLLGIDVLFANAYTCAFMWFHNLGSYKETHGSLSLGVPNRGCCCNYTNSDCGFCIVVTEDMIILINLLIIIIIMIRIIIRKPGRRARYGAAFGDFMIVRMLYANYPNN